MIPKTFKKPNSPFRARTQPMKHSLTEDVSAINVTSSNMKLVFLTGVEREALALKHRKKEADEINKSCQSLLSSASNNHNHNHHNNNNNLSKPSDSDRHRDCDWDRDCDCDRDRDRHDCDCDRDGDRDRDWEWDRDWRNRDRERDEDAKSRECAWLAKLAERECEKEKFRFSYLGFFF